jgi:hypothetical protein
MLIATAPSSYFDLTKHSVEEITLEEDIPQPTCRVTSRQKPIRRYKDFKLTDHPKINLLCEVSLYRSSTTSKYSLRIVFIKIDKDFQIKKQQTKQRVRIDLSALRTLKAFGKSLGSYLSSNTSLMLMPSKRSIRYCSRMLRD